MDTGLMLRLLVLRARLRRRDRWDAARIARHQARALRRLRRAAYAGSEFYRRHHAGLLGAPLSQLPPLTKAQLMANFDRVVTVPGLRLADVEEHLRALVAARADPALPWRGRWWTGATAGTTGRPGIFVWDRSEWAAILASYARSNDWAGVPVEVTHPVPMAVLASRTPTHQSAMVGASLRSRFVPALRLDAAAALAHTVAALNRFQPRVLVGYPSALRPLAAEQRAGRLAIRPEAVMSASEVLREPAAAEITAAWGSAPIDVYAATETAVIASSCASGTRHVYEDLVIVEPVDDAGAPVPAGTVGARILVTVLFSRTLPLIRYELTDRVALAGRGCPCGRSFVRLAAVEGRIEDVLLLPGATGVVSVHPLLFHGVLDGASLAGWQVNQEADGLRVLVVGLAPSVTAEAVRARVDSALRDAGVTATPITVRVADAVERTPLGKAPLVRALPRTDTPRRGTTT
ncbi:phenylacetate--CoA ligase family protein [Cryobacterium tagatosivorans]|uniref:Phenylacetate--CoA ligase family protein n=1 Tax=Cryobacterium tagatosivorans TaxID=1259199 RepID=A0A4R8UCJ5_9MICO|nr:phenylacetate--CoA ligase family protein [Cryobacterium tagatosivorans]TFB47293.1 phenylacetate--CoA ligase family protein [Cryobacterium tagatosivorans]